MWLCFEIHLRKKVCRRACIYVRVCARACVYMYVYVCGGARARARMTVCASVFFCLLSLSACRSWRDITIDAWSYLTLPFFCLHHVCPGVLARFTCLLFFIYYCYTWLHRRPSDKPSLAIFVSHG